MKITRLISQELFYVLIGALLIFCVMELAWDRMVLAYFNLSWVLILWVLNVIVLLALNLQEND